MPRWILPLLLLGGIVFVLEYYTFQALKTVFKNKWIGYGLLLFAIMAYANFLYMTFTYDRSKGQTYAFQWAFGFLIMALIPKLFVLIMLFGEDVVRWIKKGISHFSEGETQPIAGRRKFISQIALGLAAIPFAGIIYGVIKGKYNFKVLNYDLSFDDLPDAFDGFTITQITDIHSGSLDNKEKVKYAIDLINQQQSDVILFTGDIVNNFAHEMDAWIDSFKQLKAPVGKYAILGNHDYGEYSSWKSEEEKEANFKAIKAIHPKIGFDLLLNESRYIEKDGQKIALIGVENWGKNFKKAGDLKKASENVRKDDFKILMSHDPSHWENQVKQDDFNYHLTLSGHTHGLQFGIEIPGFIKWSPAKYAYKQWAGLYKEFGRYINVNRGFGYHAFPGRVGIWPEITVIKLKKS